MPTMSAYCKAFPMSSFAAFPEWEQRSRLPAGGGTEADGERYLFVHDGFVVTAGVFVDEDVVFDDVTDAWKAFCTKTLVFELPRIDAEPDDECGANDGR